MSDTRCQEAREHTSWACEADRQLNIGVSVVDSEMAV